MSGKSSRHHHYLSQFYLKGFTDGRSKKSMLMVIDAKEQKSFETTPRNVGGVRDFNRIESDGVDPDALEKELSKFEGEVASAIKSIEHTLEFKGDDRSLIFNLIAMMAIRSPEMREHMRKFHADISEKVMDLTLASKDRWENQVEQMREAGYDVGNVSYEDLKQFHDEKRYTIQVAREWHIHLEFVGMNAILPCLVNRGWLILQRAEDAAPLITSDHPVVLFWNDPESIPPFFRNSPGYGMKDTTVYFPLSQDVGLVGLFDIDDALIEAGREHVAHLNTVIMHMAYRQLYCPKRTCEFIGADGGLLSVKEVLQWMQ